MAEAQNSSNDDPGRTQTFLLTEAAEAHRYLEGRKTKGKVLLIP